jgi:2-amino-4-hydroxy-6-hydroxymethyldihydropteridine diphosphokinase
MVTCYIATGSNLGDRRSNIESAIKKIRVIAGTKVKKVSSVIETAPQGGPMQGPYLNAVLEAETSLTPYQLLLELRKIESMLGRVRQEINGPRTIDLDILTYGDACINEPALCIPHPRLLGRDFVMIPLGEIAPDLARDLQKKAASRKSQAASKRKATKIKTSKHKSRKTQVTRHKRPRAV